MPLASSPSPSLTSKKEKIEKRKEGKKEKYTNFLSPPSPLPIRFLRLRLLHRRLLSTSSNPNPNPPFQEPLSRIITSIRNEKDSDAFVSAFNLVSSSDPRFRLCRSIYQFAVRRLYYFKSTDAIDSLLQHQKLLPNFFQSEHFAARIIQLYARANLLDDTISTFHSLPFKPTILYNVIISSIDARWNFWKQGEERRERGWRSSGEPQG